MPTRLIQVQAESGAYAVRLVEGVFNEQYTTLSHCWATRFLFGYFFGGAFTNLFRRHCGY